MADFEPAIDFVLEHEDPGLTGAVTVDDGGVTRWGISAAAYPQLDIATLSLDDAKSIYQRDYWEPLRLGEIADQPVATKALDMAVNMGVGTASRLLQQACIVLGHAIRVDGIVGPATLAAADGCNGAALLAELRLQSRDRYLAIIQSDPERYGRYAHNWLARAGA
ncbi:MAG: hypothetical protein KGL39_49705 [Patescibacteria group bacterium]|nr:hypothetical protein [Patescibacteria group bacterium]